MSEKKGGTISIAGYGFEYPAHFNKAIDNVLTTCDIIFYSALNANIKKHIVEMSKRSVEILIHRGERADAVCMKYIMWGNKINGYRHDGLNVGIVTYGNPIKFCNIAQIFALYSNDRVSKMVPGISLTDCLLSDLKVSIKHGVQAYEITNAISNRPHITKSTPIIFTNVGVFSPTQSLQQLETIHMINVSTVTPLRTYLKSRFGFTHNVSITLYWPGDGVNPTYICKTTADDLTRDQIPPLCALLLYDSHVEH